MLKSLKTALAYLLLSISPLSVYAALNGPCTGDEATGEYGTKGTCISTSDCTRSGGHYKSGACPFDPNDVKCCVIDSTSSESEGAETATTESPEPTTPPPEVTESSSGEPEVPETTGTTPNAPEPTFTEASAAIANPIAALLVGLAAIAI
ncbi:unnamed protein product [Parascedosporium putredinis]|uniref:Uncharacterized protein n=1 Tax=Parascedosporium putredinis TaxID=1442378 RepID=A0A9P1MCN1_9PEZI|nr:unnamed protein product [Parascedosporium putredinis]CAI7996903.1 unnamed protein product [Parascedosporium putredinis]